MKKAGFFAMLRLPFRYASGSALLAIAYYVGAALVPAGKTLATAWFIDTALAIVRDGAAQAAIVRPILALTVLIAYEWLAPYAHKLIFTRMELTLRQNLKAQVIEKRARLAYPHIEDAKAWDLIARVCADPEAKVKDAYHHALEGLQFFVSTASVMAILLAYAWWVGLLLVVLCVPIFSLSLQSGKKQYDAEKEASQYDRRHTYLLDVLNAREYVDERALFGYSGRLLRAYAGFYGKASGIRVRMQMKWMSRSKAPAILIGIVMTGVLFALLMPVVHGQMSPGTYIALVGAINTMTFGFSWQLSGTTDSLARSNEYMKDYAAFFALSETEDATCAPAWGMAFDTLTFAHVTFAYPGTDSVVLDDLSFTLHNGQHYAFVGANGAGKTTVTKLICGLYDDFEGEILLNGRDIRTYAQAQRKALASCVFQDFSRYPLSLYDNIAMGCVGAEDVPARVRRAAEAVQLLEAAERLPEGLHTPLGKLDERGTDLSGGQWQRVALARALASPAPLKILDEPTAALDPMAESAVYAQFEQISRGITTLFISHRLASAKLADIIFVLDGGRVKESGSHDALMVRGGLYAQMFERQRSWYV